MAGSSSLLSLAAMAVLLVGLAAAQGPSPSKSPPSPYPTPHRRLLATMPRLPKFRSPADTLNTKGLTPKGDMPNNNGILEDEVNTEKTPEYGRVEVPDFQTNSSPSDPRPPPPPRPPAPPVTPAHQLSYATLLAGEPAPGHSGAVSGWAVSGGAVSGGLSFGFAGSVAIGALVAGLVI